MKIELIKSYDLDDEYEKYFYTRNEEKKQISRRDFIKYFTVSVAGLALPLGVTNDANAFLPILIRAVIPLIIPTLASYASHEKTTGDVLLGNNKNIIVKGDLNLTLVREWDFNEFSTRYANYEVPPNKVQQYRFSNGPSGTVKKNTEAFLLAKSRIDHQPSKSITLIA